jgi:hypothetical protein
VRSLLPLIPLFGMLVVLTACPPVRENVTNAEGGGGEEGYFAWREPPYGEAPHWGILFIPRDDQHDCNGMIGYDWSDADLDYARINVSKARGLDWETTYNNSYLGCGSWYDTDRRCFDGFDYREGEYVVLAANSTLTIDTYTDEQVRGSWWDDEGDRHGFRVENCGELPYYWDMGDAELPERSGRAKTPDEASPQRGSWRLRFK